MHGCRAASGITVITACGGRAGVGAAATHASIHTTSPPPSSSHYTNAHARRWRLPSSTLPRQERSRAGFRRTQRPSLTKWVGGGWGAAVGCCGAICAPHEVEHTAWLLRASMLVACSTLCYLCATPGVLGSKGCARRPGAVSNQQGQGGGRCRRHLPTPHAQLTAPPLLTALVGLLRPTHPRRCA